MDFELPVPGRIYSAAMRKVNLLTEKRATQIIQMLDRLSTRLDVDQHHDETSLLIRD